MPINPVAYRALAVAATASALVSYLAYTNFAVSGAPSTNFAKNPVKSQSQSQAQIQRTATAEIAKGTEILTSPTKNPALFGADDPPSEKEIIDELAAIKNASQSQLEATLLARAKANLWNDVYLICTFANLGHYEFAMNWLLSLGRLDYREFLVLCSDIGIYEKLVRKGLKRHIALIPPGWLGDTITTSEAKWQTPEYDKLTRTKPRVINKLMQRDFTVFYNDDDLVWLSRSIMPCVDLVHPTVEFLYMVDIGMINTGCYMARPSQDVKGLFNTTVEMMETNPTHDQLIMNPAFYALGLNAKQTFRPFERLLVANGEIFLFDKKNKEHGVGPWIYHATGLVGKEEKKKAFVDAGFWFFDGQ